MLGVWGCQRNYKCRIKSLWWASTKTAQWKSRVVLISSSCGWKDQESQRRQNSLPKEAVSRGDLELEEWLNTLAKDALGHENYSELKALEKQKVQGRCSDLALFLPESRSWKTSSSTISTLRTKKHSGDQRKGVGGWHIVQTDLAEVTSIFRCTTEWFSYTYTYTNSFSDSFLIQNILFTEYWVDFPVLHSRSLLVIHCCPPETNTALYINYTPIHFFF